MRLRTSRLTSAISGKLISQSMILSAVSAGVGVAVGEGGAVGVSVGYGVGVGVGMGVRVCSGEGVGDSGITEGDDFEEFPIVQRMAPTARRRTIATPIERTSTGDTARFGPSDSSWEPHSGQRNSFVTTVIFSFR